MAISLIVGDFTNVPVSDCFQASTDAGLGAGTAAIGNLAYDKVSDSILLPYKTEPLITDMGQVTWIYQSSLTIPDTMGIVYTGEHLSGQSMALLPWAGYVGKCITEGPYHPAWGFVGDTATKILTGSSVRAVLYVPPIKALTDDEITSLYNEGYTIHDLRQWRVAWLAWGTEVGITLNSDLGNQPSLSITNGYAIKYRPGVEIAFYYYDESGNEEKLANVKPAVKTDEVSIEFILLDRGDDGISVLSDAIPDGGVDIRNPAGSMANNSLPVALFSCYGLAGAMFEVLKFESSASATTRKMYLPGATDANTNALVSWTQNFEAEQNNYCSVSYNKHVQTDNTGKTLAWLTINLSTSNSRFTPMVHAASIVRKPTSGSSSICDLSNNTVSLSRSQEIFRQSATLKVEIVAPTSQSTYELADGTVISFPSNPAYDALHGRVLWPIKVDVEGVAFFRGFIESTQQSNKGGVYNFDLTCMDYGHILDVTPIMVKADFRGWLATDAIEWLLKNIIGMDSSQFTIESATERLPKSSKKHGSRFKIGTSVADAIKQIHEVAWGMDRIWGFTWSGKFYSVSLPSNTVAKQTFYASRADAVSAGSEFWLRKPLKESTQFRHGSFANSVTVWSHGLAVNKTDYRSISDPTYPWWIGRKIEAHAFYSTQLTRQAASFVAAALLNRLSKFNDEVSFTSAYDPNLVAGDVIGIKYSNGTTVYYRIISMEATLDKKSEVVNNTRKPVAHYKVVVAWW